MRQWLGLVGVKTLSIEPGSPWENGSIESFNGKLRDELLAREVFDTLHEARVLIERWRKAHNTVRPHSSPGYRPAAPESRRTCPLALATRQQADRGDAIGRETLLIETGSISGGRSVFLFGIQTCPAYLEIAEKLPSEAWETLKRPTRSDIGTQPRARSRRVTQQVVKAREFNDIRLAKESAAEFMRRPNACGRDYRVIVLVKELEVHLGQTLLFDDTRCFLDITNDVDEPADEVAFEANHPCCRGSA